MSSNYHLQNKKQIDIGDETEIAIGKIFQKNGYWCHIFQKKVSGQPVDIIAIKENINWLIDAKHLEENKKSFPFSRIEMNQIESLTYAKEYAGIKRLGFAICVGNDHTRAFFLPFDYFMEMYQNGLKSVKISLLEDLQEVLDKC